MIICKYNTNNHSKMNSKKKGSKFERNIAKWFTSWTGFKFQRTPYSGANHYNKDLASDIMCSDERHAHRCKISIECKSYRDIKFEHLLLGNKGAEIEKFWEQVNRDATRSNKVPILCMRYNSMPSNDFFFVFPGYMKKAFLGVFSEPTLTISFKGHTLVVAMAHTVLESVDYKEVHKLAKQRANQ